MDINKKDVGNRINSIRLSLGDNMREFGERIGNQLGLSKEDSPSDSIVSRWEKGVSLPNNERLKKIAELGSISIDELIHGTTKEKELLKRENELWKSVKQVAEEGLDVIQSNEEVTESRKTLISILNVIQTTVTEVIELLNNGSKKEALEKLETLDSELDVALYSEVESDEELEFKKSSLLRQLDLATKKLNELEQ